MSNSFSPGGHINLEVAFKGLNVILGLYKCNYSLTVKLELGAAAGYQIWPAGFVFVICVLKVSRSIVSYLVYTRIV